MTNNLTVNPKLSYYMELGSILTEGKTILEKYKPEGQPFFNHRDVERYYEATKQCAQEHGDMALVNMLNRPCVDTTLEQQQKNLVKRHTLDTLLQMVINATTGMAIQFPETIKVVADPNTFRGLMIVPGVMNNTADSAINYTKGATNKLSSALEKPN